MMLVRQHHSPYPPSLAPSLSPGLKNAGLIRRNKFVDSASIKRQALYEKNRLQALKEAGKEGAKEGGEEEEETEEIEV